MSEIPPKSLQGVTIARGALTRAGQIVKEIAPTGRVFLCADTIVMNVLGGRVTHALTKSGLQVQPHTFPPGEESKSLEVAANLFDWLAAQRAERREPLIALGGGVAGDLIGFVAATYARGIPLVQIPTTLLAQIDSSIGGKVAVDLPAGKNLVGAFYPAHRVIIDPDALPPLPREQLIADYAEV
ncbi:MAG: iron-containing alcohol dehydrogenase, partial [Chloroflexota bacterium]|nr:iron-containing alcohol dehydrogenase [Chloroflexota bacterium]